MCVRKYIEMSPAVLQHIVLRGHARGRGKLRGRKGGFTCLKCTFEISLGVCLSGKQKENSVRLCRMKPAVSEACGGAPEPSKTGPGHCLVLYGPGLLATAYSPESKYWS